MNQTDSAPKDSTSMRFVRACVQTVYLLSGAKFVGIVLMAVGLELHGWPSWIPWLLGGSIVFYSFQKTIHIVLVSLLAVGAFILVLGVLALLAFLAAGGSFGSLLSGQVSSGGYFWVLIYLIIAILWLLIGVPYRAFEIELDRDGQGAAQKTLVGMLAAVASIVSGTFILMLHFGGGPLDNIDIKLLVAGTIFTMVLVLPIYRSVAKTCWERGLRGLFYPKCFVERWGKTFAELDAVLEAKIVQYSEGASASCKELG